MYLAGLASNLHFYFFSDPLARLEAVFVFGALLLSFLVRKRSRFLRRMDSLPAICATHKARTMIGILLTTLLLHAAASFFRPARQPAVHDEFSYILAADTFLQGRMSNPPHPMWEHFETVHVLSRPTYASMYPPMQGIILAGGKILTGHYLGGAWICAAVLCALTYWMLIGWVPAWWACFGTFLCVVRIGILSYWANSYWGAAHTAIAGVLLMGAIPRIVSKPRKTDAVLVGFGLLMLANSRPFEGLFFAVSFMILLLFRFRHTNGIPIRRAFLRIAPLCTAILIAGFGATAYYNRRVTGNWARMPQQENMSSYGLALLPWQSIQAKRVPLAGHLRDFYERQRVRFLNSFTVSGFIKSRFTTFSSFWRFYVYPLLTLPLLFFLYNWRRKRHFHLLIAGIIFSISLMANPWFFAHYASPAFGLFWLMAIMGMRCLYSFRIKGSRCRPFQFFVLGMPLCMIVLATTSVLGVAFKQIQPPSDEHIPAWHHTGAGDTQRGSILSRLNAFGGKHLVLISYAPNHLLAKDWVYNEADIDNSNVVFAHDLGDAYNERLFRYYPYRQVWITNIDLAPGELRRLR